MNKRATPGPERKTETNNAVLRPAMLRRLPRRLTARGEVSFPAVPALLDHYLQSMATTFSVLGRAFSEAEVQHMRGILERKLSEGFAASPYAKVVVSYETDPLPKTSLSYRVRLNSSTIADEYDHWVQTRKPPLFGEHPDAKVMDLARSLGSPAEVPVLDIGAGTGRNTLPLSRAGFPTDAIELAPALAAILRDAVAKEGLAVRVYEGDALDSGLDVPKSHYRLIVLAEVIASHFREVAQIRALIETAAETLAPGGLLAFSAFLARDGYKPDVLAKQLSQVFWCCLFTRRELSEAFEGQPFELVSDESTHAYEKANLAPEAWPPTGWFEEWTRGQDLFDLPPEKSPFELRWLVYRRR
jgi:SAM-dependent methyltransferase